MKKIYISIYLMIISVVGFSQWTIQITDGITPWLHSVHFPDANTGYAAGHLGTILKTTNGGLNWSSQSSETNAKLNSIYFTDINNGYTVGDIGTILKTTNGGTNWSAQSSGTSSMLTSVYFIDANTGYIAGFGGEIRKTTNSGTSWAVLTSGTTIDLNSVLFIDSNTGYAVGGFMPPGNVFIKTTNGGANWASQTCGTIYDGLFDICFTDINTGYAVGYLGNIFKTTNGGTNWILQTSEAMPLYSVCFTDANTGYAVGYSTMKKTTNGGINWTNQEGMQNYYLSSVYFTDTNTGYAVGYTDASDGVVLKTTNAGTNWDIQDIHKYYNSVCFTDVNTGYAIGNLYNNATPIMKTTNGGTNWSIQTSGANNSLNSVYFTDANTGYAVGKDGTILKTTNGGTNWIAQTSGTTNWLYSVCFDNTNTGYVVGANGTIIKTTNGGTNWSAQTSGTTNLLKSAFFNDANNGCVVGEYGKILKTTNGGTNWSTQTSGTTYNLNSVYFANTNIGYSVGGIWGQESPILKTTNGGSNWSIQASGVTNGLNGVCFTDVSVGYAVGNSGKILITTNGGANWAPQTSGTNYELYSVYFANANTGYVGGNEGTILKTTTGGWCTGIASQPTGTNSLCQSSGSNDYTTSGAVNANTYIWEIIPSTAGTIIGTGLIGTVNWNSSFSGMAQITVKGHNSCGNGLASSPIAVTVSPTSIGGSINGSDTICIGYSTGTLTLSGHTGNIIKWQKRFNAESWTDIANTSNTYNEIPSSIGTWKYRAEVQSGFCASLYSDSAIILVNAFPENGGTITGTTTVCQGQSGAIYTVPLIANATTYIWTLPDGATGSSSTNSITVNYGLSAVSGNITVKGHNSCGEGAISSLAINVNTIPSTPTITQNILVLTSNAPMGNQWYLDGSIIPDATNQNYTVITNGYYTDIVTINDCISDTSNVIIVFDVGLGSFKNNKTIRIIPNPASDNITINLTGFKNQSGLCLNIYNIQGQLLMQQNLKQNNTEIDISQLQQGVYIAKIKLGDGSVLQEKFVVVK